MLIPLKPLDFDVAPQSASALPVSTRFTRARVLARWHGTPLGIVHVSVRAGFVHRADVIAAIRNHHADTICSEAVERSLLRSGITGRTADLLAHNPPPKTLPVRPTVSIAICTRDRPEDMAACLASLARLDPAPLEILVVDNAPSTNATLELVHTKFPGVRYVREDRPGLDHARNRAIQESTGDVIAFTDDDVVVDRGWIGALANAFVDPAVALVTGLIEPLELESRAQILFENYGGFGRGCRRTYLQASPNKPMPWTLIGAGQLGAGANMALRRRILFEIGAFDPAMDVGTPSLGGGDHEMFFRVLRAGHLCVYEPRAVVRHRHRRTVAELRQLLYAYGYATRCFFERIKLNFPADASGVQRLQRWWWRHWAWQRWWRSSFRPPLVSPELVLAEIRGFHQGRGGYLRSRRRVVANETARPDAFRPTISRTPRPVQEIGIVTIDTSRPLGSIEEAINYRKLEILVQWRERPVGRIQIVNHGSVISAARLAHEVSRTLWPALLAPRDDAFSAVREALLESFSAAVRSPFDAGTPSTDDAVSIIVTTCGRPEQLHRCLQSLVQLQTNRPVQIIVVDNRPEAPTAESVAQEFAGIECVSEHRHGSSYARNAGIAAARHGIVAMMDDDMTATPSWLEQLLTPFARADVMAVTGNTLPGRLETEAERMLELYGGFGRGFKLLDFDDTWFHRNSRRAVPTWKIGGSGNAAFRTEIFHRHKIGLFDGRLGAGVPTGVGEDTKMFYDILHAGFTIVYQPAAVAWHYHRATMRDLKQQLYGYSKGHVAYHLITFFERGDARALVRIFFELPCAFARRGWERFRGRYPYPWALLAVEFIGTLAGPWSLWRATRLDKRVNRQLRRDPQRDLQKSSPLLTPKPPVWEAQS